MHRVIIPVDFSETSLNAARYTARMLAGKEDATAILYTNYESPDDADLESPPAPEEEVLQTFCGT